MLNENLTEAYGVTAVELLPEPVPPTAYRYEIAVVLIHSVTGEEALHRFEANDDRIGTVLDEVRTAGYARLWGLHETFVTDRNFDEF
ncbi:MAG: hypothetical protein AAGD09_03525 [Cyanobacteria bacterium P01_F01_bin.56]